MRKLILILCSILSTWASSQSLKELYNQSVNAYETKDYKRFLELNLKALEFHPSQPTILYNTAIAYAKNNDVSTSKRYVSKLLSWNAELPFEKDADLEDLLEDKVVLDSLIQLKNLYNTTKSVSELQYTIHGKYHFESVLEVNHQLWLTDIHNRQLMVFHMENQKLYAKNKFELPPLAIIGDLQNNSVWVSTGNVLNTLEDRRYPPRLVEISMENHQESAAIELPENSIIGAMIKLDTSHIMATDSSEPRLFIIDIVEKKITRTIQVEEGFNLQGISLDAKNAMVYMADYIKGICFFNINTPEKRFWISSDNYLLKGIDGLTVLNEHQLIAVQNNSTPKKVILITHEKSKITGIEILDSGIFDGGEPTNGEYLKNKGFLYISNTPWPHYDKEMKPQEEKWEQPEIRLISDKILIKE
ncbi:tetratricopeptide repeat protein [Maribacter sp. 2210JD10-5]|uniref:tetratricopeptide repeat protein n=1 Tax=Maribacter sp. 2210JD10-5 TaxID=3386272 RepID=UPI0039BCC6F0